MPVIPFRSPFHPDCFDRGGPVTSPEQPRAWHDRAGPEVLRPPRPVQVTDLILASDLLDMVALRRDGAAEAADRDFQQVGETDWLAAALWVVTARDAAGLSTPLDFLLALGIPREPAGQARAMSGRQVPRATALEADAERTAALEGLCVSHADGEGL